MGEMVSILPDYQTLLDRALYGQPLEPSAPTPPPTNPKHRYGDKTLPDKVTASDILREAHDIVVGARNSTHGDKERSFTVIAQLWDVYLNGRKEGGHVTPFDVAQMMVLLKIGRSIQGTRIKDHMVDQAGYSGVAGELM